MQKAYLILTWEEGRNMLEEVKPVLSLQEKEATEAETGCSNKWNWSLKHENQLQGGTQPGTWGWGWSREQWVGEGGVRRLET